jgi:hypothetical protein
MSPLEKANQIAIAKLRQENEIMRQLGTRIGFYRYYYDQCKNYETNKLAFEAVNDLYFSLFNHYRFTDYLSFKSATTYHNKNNKL